MDPLSLLTLFLALSAIADHQDSSNVPTAEPPIKVRQKAMALLDAYLGRTMVCGDSVVVDGWWIEVHTLGCRNAADEPREEWERSHFLIYDEYLSDGISTVEMDGRDENFVTMTPQRN